VERYAANEQVFFDEFAVAFEKLLHNGCPGEDHCNCNCMISWKCPLCVASVLETTSRRGCTDVVAEGSSTSAPKNTFPAVV
jgi:hypothetical protein